MFVENGPHDGPHTSIDCARKRWIVHLKSSAFVYNLGHTMAVGLLVVLDPMLGICYLQERGNCPLRNETLAGATS